MFYWVLKIFIGPLVRLIWVKEVSGIENIPRKGPLIIAANHSSYFDFITLVAVSPRRIRFLAAEVFYKSVFWQPIMILTGQIKVDRKSHDKTMANKKIEEHLNQGNVIGIFPEGTRSRSGKLQKSFTGVAKIALQNKVDILPVAISGAYEVMAPHDKKPKFIKTIVIDFLDLVKLSEVQDKTPENITHKLVMSKIAGKINQDYF